MSKQIKIIFDLEDLSDLITSFQTNLNRQTTSFTVEELEQQGKAFLEQVHSRLEEDNLFWKALIRKSIEVFTAFKKEELKIRSKMQHYEEVVEEKTAAIDMLNDHVTDLQSEVEGLKTHCQKLQRECSESEYQLHQQQSQLRESQKQIQQNVSQAQQYSKMEQQMLTKLEEENQSLNKYLNLTKSKHDNYEEEKSEIENQTEMVQERLKEKERLLEVAESRLMYEIQKKEEAEAKLIDKERIIEKQEMTIYELNQVLKRPFERMSPDDDLKEERLNPSVVLKIPLSEELESQNSGIYSLQAYLHKKPQQNGFPEDGRQQNGNHKSQDSQNKRGIRKIVPDPYFAHFILTSQAVKIKQDCQQLLNIDIKPYYEEIIKNRVPMHLWDQWIRNRLRDLLRNQNSHRASQQE